MINAILWDNDGTLIESEPIYRDAAIKAFKKYKIDLTHTVIDKYSALALKDYFQALINHYEIKISPDEMIKEYRAHGRKSHKKIKLTPHIRGILNSLKSSYKMGIVTNANRDWLEYILTTHRLRHFFKVTITRDDVLEGKPFAEPYLKAAYSLGAKPNETVVIEDSTLGFQGAKAAGMLIIARKSPYNTGQDFSLADYVVEDLREIQNILATI